MTIIEIIAVIVLGILIAGGFRLYKMGMAADWLATQANIIRFRKHYSQEGINVYISYRDQTVEVSFHHKGVYYSRSISFVNAIAYMEKTPDGGIRKLLIEKLK